MKAKGNRGIFLIGGLVAAILVIAVVAVVIWQVAGGSKTTDSNNNNAATSGFRAYADAGAAALYKGYNKEYGVWNSDTASWWHSANALNAMIDYMVRTGSTQYRDVIGNTFEVHKNGSASNPTPNFINKFYDDEGWWAIAWINAYDLTKEQRYLDMSKTIFTNMTTAWDDTCGGGLWWSKERKYKNAIPNSLFLTIAARLHLRTPGDTTYLDWAKREWQWFKNSGMLNSNNLVNDGLGDDCKNNRDTTWTYNQGVLIGGLTDLYKATQDKELLSTAEKVADASISILATGDGILQEPCESKDCGKDGPQFKGLFMRNFYYLNTVLNKPAYRDFIQKNATSIWNKARNADNQFGLFWSGPFDKSDGGRQSAAQDALNAAI